MSLFHFKLVGLLRGKKREQVSIQKSKKPEWNSITKSQLDIICCNIGSVKTHYLFMSFIPATDFKIIPIINSEVCFTGKSYIGDLFQLITEKGLPHIANIWLMIYGKGKIVIGVVQINLFRFGQPARLPIFLFQCLDYIASFQIPDIGEQAVPRHSNLLA